MRQRDREGEGEGKVKATRDSESSVSEGRVGGEGEGQEQGEERGRERERDNCDATRDSVRVACGRERESVRDFERARPNFAFGTATRPLFRALLVSVLLTSNE